MAAIRLYVGGLGERVTEADIRTTFGNLGSVQSVEIIRTKGRSFGYIDFLPLSDNSLSKLLSTYNGCSWKGGKLKLEKAKQHYIDRLKQEWAEDAELQNIEDKKDSVTDDSVGASPQLKSTLDLEKMQFRLFFPKLRKVKALPLRGTGKHKYSFQRVQVPALPSLFCDCPEHRDAVEIPKVARVHDSDLQSETMNAEEVSMMNSVMDRLLIKGTRKYESIQPSGEDQDHDSLDGGMNDEEINVMNSVMEKLFDRQTAKAQRKDLRESSQMNVPTLELEENVKKMDVVSDEEDDDDDIKINVGSVQNVGYDSWEKSLVNKMAGSSEQRTSDAAGNKLDVGNRIVKPLTKKRKSVSNKSDDKDLASPVQRKRVRLETRTKEVEEHLESEDVKEFETNKSVTGGMWSQKSSWKELIGDGRGGSFQLSNIKPGGQANDVDKLKSGGETSSDKEIGRVRKVMNKEHKSSIITSSDKVELESDRNVVHENVDDKSLVTLDAEEIQAAQPLESSAGLDKVARGSSWLQKSSWTQLVGSGNSSSFSISQIVPGDVLEKQQLSKPKDDNTMNKFHNSGALVNERRMGENAFGGARGSKFGFGGIDKRKEAQAADSRGIQLNEAPKGNDSYGLSMAMKFETEKKKVSNAQPGVGISETCPFMRSADSLKEWQNAKATLAKKRKNE